jgi:hypothetical protein
MRSVLKENLLLQGQIVVGYSMCVCFQESRVVQNQVESAQNLHSSSHSVRNAQLSQPNVNDDANVVVVEVVLRC